MVNPINKNYIISNAFIIQAAILLAKILVYSYLIFIIIKLNFINNYNNLLILC